MPLLASAGEYDIGYGDITITVTGNDSYTIQYSDAQGHHGRFDIGNIVLTGTTDSYHVYVEYPNNVGSLNITFRDLNISISNSNDAAFYVNGSPADRLTIELDGTNTLKSGNGHAGLEKSGYELLTIKDDDRNGSLSATGGDGGAGIGARANNQVGNISILGGTITAKGGESAAGIGGSSGGGGETSNIVIEGGTVTAIGGDYGAGIGSGDVSFANHITIRGGEVYAVGGYGAAGIGGGCDSHGSADITIRDQARVYVSGGASDGYFLAGAAVGDGSDENGGAPIPGAEVVPDTSALNGGVFRIFPAGTGVQTMKNGEAPSNGSGSSRSGSGSSNRHEHSYEWVIVQAATPYEDGIIQYRCNGCGHVETEGSFSYLGNIFAQMSDSILSARPGDTVTVNTYGYHTINKVFAEKFASSGVKLVLNFTMDHAEYTLTIPAGFDLTQTINEDGYAGYRFIGSFPGVTLEEAAER